MADGSGPLPPAEERGSLTVADRVIERIAVRAARDVPGVTSVGGRVEQAVGRQLPRADALVAGGRVRIGMEIAVRWPARLPATTGAVRAAVAEHVSRLAGMPVDAVDVTAAKVLPPEQDDDRRVL